MFTTVVMYNMVMVTRVLPVGGELWLEQRVICNMRGGGGLCLELGVHVGNVAVVVKLVQHHLVTSLVKRLAQSRGITSSGLIIGEK